MKRIDINGYKMIMIIFNQYFYEMYFELTIVDGLHLKEYEFKQNSKKDVKQKVKNQKKCKNKKDNLMSFLLTAIIYSTLRNFGLRIFF